MKKSSILSIIVFLISITYQDIIAQKDSRAPCVAIEGRDINNNIFMCYDYKNFYVGVDQNVLTPLGHRFYVGGDSYLNGNVGIGVSALNSQYKLNVSGGMNLLGGTSAAGKALSVKGAEALWYGQNNGGLNYFSWGYGADFNYFKDGLAIGYNAGSVPNPPLGGITTTGKIVTEDNLQVNKNAIVDGKVGIGVANPTEKLEIAGGVNILKTGKVLSINNDEALWYDGDYYSWGYGGNWNYFRDGLTIGFTPGSASAPSPNGMNVLGTIGVNTQNPNTQYSIHTKGRIAASNWGDLNKQIIIGHSGANATINATNAARLHVGLGDNLDALILGEKAQGDETDLRISGQVYTCKVNTSEVEVKTGWCDYVFEKDYDLMPLEKVEEFINENQHLPKIPPASVVEEEGLQMASMQVKMMEKIEELTLYVIEQNKKIKALEARIK